MNYGDNIQVDWWDIGTILKVAYREDIVGENWYMQQQLFRKGYSWAYKAVVI